ncbi:MAG: tetratricopeptide repeat protein [Longimicrobiales bacterium]
MTRLSALSLFLSALLVACDPEEPALARGDAAWADSSYEAALAEYRLAAARDADPETVARVAHAYARLGETSRARQWYARLLAEDDDWADQAAYDFLLLAERAIERGDRHGMATAAAAALDVRPSLNVAALAPRLASYYEDTGDPARAVRYYERALAAAPPDSAPRYLYEIGRLHHAQGNCAAALGYLAAFRHLETQGVASVGPSGDVAPGRRLAIEDELASQAHWSLGACAFEEAKRMHQDGKLAEALQHLETVLSLGVPQSVQDHAWFQRGEILYAIGRRDAALAAYRQVLDLNPTGAGQLVERARQRIDQIRFGG